MIPVLDIISNGLGALKEFFGWRREKAVLENTPEMQANAKADQDAQAADAARQAVAEGDADEIRKGLS